MASLGRILRALFAFLACPGLVAGLLPLLLARGAAPRGLPAVAGGVLLGIGGVLLLWCVRDFFTAGRGTLAPWDPPRRLVVVGLYRFVRNPMYLSVLLLVAGWALLFRTPSLLAYLLGLAVIFRLRVVYFEEPALRRQFGTDWDDYARTVPRWVPQFRPPGRKP
jgi:protein-S-isoprenylcysteine O-methyltransferase Ste14